MSGMQTGVGRMGEDVRHQQSRRKDTEASWPGCTASGCTYSKQLRKHQGLNPLHRSTRKPQKGTKGTMASGVGTVATRSGWAGLLHLSPGLLLLQEAISVG